MSTAPTLNNTSKVVYGKVVLNSGNTGNEIMVKVPFNISDKGNFVVITPCTDIPGMVIKTPRIGYNEQSNDKSINQGDNQSNDQTKNQTGNEDLISEKELMLELDKIIKNENDKGNHRDYYIPRLIQPMSEEGAVKGIVKELVTGKSLYQEILLLSYPYNLFSPQKLTKEEKIEKIVNTLVEKIPIIMQLNKDIREVIKNKVGCDKINDEEKDNCEKSDNDFYYTNKIMYYLKKYAEKARKDNNSDDYGLKELVELKEKFKEELFIPLEKKLRNLLGDYYNEVSVDSWTENIIEVKTDKGSGDASKTYFVDFNNLKRGIDWLVLLMDTPYFSFNHYSYDKEFENNLEDRIKEKLQEQKDKGVLDVYDKVSFSIARFFRSILMFLHSYEKVLDISNKLDNSSINDPTIAINLVDLGKYLFQTNHFYSKTLLALNDLYKDGTLKELSILDLNRDISTKGTVYEKHVLRSFMLSITHSYNELFKSPKIKEIEEQARNAFVYNLFGLHPI